MSGAPPFELIVHVGMGKTGTSSIQKTLSANQSQLRQHGATYLGLMLEEAPVRRYPWQRAGAWPEWLALPEPERSGQLREVLGESIDKLKREGMTRAIWSNESIFGNDRLIAPVLGELQRAGAGVRIIVYVRRHDAWARSAYLQWGIKHKTYAGPLKSFREWHTAQRTTFYPALEPWLVGDWLDAAVRNFDACGDVVADFLEQYGLARAGIAIKRVNDTPAPALLALWALFNAQMKEPTLPSALERTLTQAGLLGGSPSDCDFNALLPTAEELRAVRHAAQADRQRLNGLFRVSGQPEMDTSELDLVQSRVTQNQINAALLLMIKRQSDQIDRLQRLVDEKRTRSV